MANVCVNYLRASGSEEQLTHLMEKLGDEFGEIIGEDIDDGCCEFYIDSSWRFPCEVFREIIKSMPNTDGLYIRVSSDEPATEYLQQSIFRDGGWNFDDKPDINSEILSLTALGLEQIRKVLSDKGSMSIGNDQQETWSAYYTDRDGCGDSSFYSMMELESNGKLSVKLENGVWLYEDDLTTIHVMDILTLIKEGHGKFTK